MKLVFQLLLLFLFNLSLSAQPKNMDTNYSVEIIRYTISSENRAAFETAYAEAGKLLQQSSYCLGYKLIRGVEEPNKYILVIHWTSLNDHLQGFRKSELFPPFFNLVKPFYNNIEEMKHYEHTETQWAKQ